MEKRTPEARDAEKWMLEQISASRAPVDIARSLRKRTNSQERAVSNEARVNLRRSNRGR